LYDSLAIVIHQIPTLVRLHRFGEGRVLLNDSVIPDIAYEALLVEIEEARVKSNTNKDAKMTNIKGGRKI